MSRINGKINLLQLHAVRKVLTGKDGPIECVVLPIAKNNLFVGEKGIYLDLVAFEIKEKKGESKDTHILKQSFSKEVRDKMSEDELKALPILGNLQVIGEYTEADPVSSPAVQDEISDLPFN